MQENSKIYFIPPKPPKREKRVGIYCRVSTNSVDQLKSLKTQVSELTRLTAATPQWLLVDEATNVTKIFDMYLYGKSVIGIVTDLERLGVKSPTGKDKWSKRTIDMMLSNEKYTGSVRLLDNGKQETVYLCENNNPAIISKETFQAVQIEKTKRSNVIKGENGVQRKSKKYSSKQ